MKIKWMEKSSGNTTDITDYVSTITWSGSTSQVSRSLEISVAYSPYDKNIKNPNIQIGDRLKLLDDDGKILINAMVYYRERTGEQGTITYSGYDNLNRLLKSTGTYNFKKITPEAITKTVCDKLKISTGNIAITGICISSLLVDSENHYDIIMKAYTKAFKSNGRKYMVVMSDENLYVIEKGEVVSGFTLNDKINIINSTYTESLDSMVNRVKIYDDSGNEIGEVKNSDWATDYGIFQGTYTKEDGINYNAAAKNILTGINKTASIEALGNINCISGYGIKIMDSITGLTGNFWIDSDTHTWENNVHTMSLELAFKNIMDTGDDA